ncbi:MAG: hypothetical protein U5S82_24605 [Gammaproteobacteria bacterium]|nr:hypothetical protein [Gammaproteobacteria bacterium]
MRRIATTMTGVMVLGLLTATAMAADSRQAAIDAYPGLTEHAKMIRRGKLETGKRYSMHDEEGRFHVIHVDEIDMECSSCHVGARYAKDYLLLGRDQAERKAAGTGKGETAEVTDRAVCLGCHKQGGIAQPWYRTASER